MGWYSFSPLPARTGADVRPHTRRTEHSVCLLQTVVPSSAKTKTKTPAVPHAHRNLLLLVVSRRLFVSTCILPEHPRAAWPARRPPRARSPPPPSPSPLPPEGAPPMPPLPLLPPAASHRCRHRHRSREGRPGLRGGGTRRRRRRWWLAASGGTPELQRPASRDPVTILPRCPRTPSVDWKSAGWIPAEIVKQKTRNVYQYTYYTLRTWQKDTGKGLWNHGWLDGRSGVLPHLQAE